MQQQNFLEQHSTSSSQALFSILSLQLIEFIHLEQHWQCSVMDVIMYHHLLLYVFCELRILKIGSLFSKSFLAGVTHSGFTTSVELRNHSSKDLRDHMGFLGSNLGRPHAKLVLYLWCLYSNSYLKISCAGDWSLADCIQGKHLTQINNF